MNRDEFDARYPEMFQPGGEEHDFQVYIPEPAPQNPDHASFRAPQAPREDRVTAVRATAVEARSGSGGQLPEPATESPHRTQPEAHDVHTHQFSSHEQEHEHGEREEPHHFTTPLTRRVSRWSARSWVAASVAILVVFAGSAFCLLATFLIPSSASPDPTENHGVMLVPWGFVIFPGAPALFTAGLGMLAALLLVAARHYVRRAWWFQAAAALVGIAALAVGAVTLFSEQLFTELIYSPNNYQQDSPAIPWYSVFAMANAQLLVLGPALLSVVVILHPGRMGTPTIVSAKTTFWTGMIVTASGVWAWFAQQLFPLAEGKMLELEDQNITTSPWTYNLSQGGGPLILVGTAVLFWCVLILATSHRVLVETTPVESDSDDDDGALETAEGSYIQGTP
ncbi:hypothetical protein AS189_04575 [Arthrobacter alpinus]|uniref:Uncharacterized protein n=1 Tax=Arthrobacter alpinus TaxID=656366 RepID=A0A0S2LXC0_9MICC|nr:hypothetical protein [Arthrobacter alpinus]ALO65895.1 hypothetical protein AS189_04575 [Arthrobacter alpinus]